MTILEKVKVMVGVENKDSLLTLLIEQAEKEFKQSTNRNDIPDTAENIILDMVVIKYNLIGTEGLASSSFNGASEAYNQYPEQLKKAIARYRKAKFL